MTLHNLLETFDGVHSGSKGNDPELIAELERAKTAAFEAGYSSGWEDAAASDKEAWQRIEAEFERNIQNMSFTYAEAVDRVRGELEEFISALINEFVPAIAPISFVEKIKSEIVSVADDTIDVPVEIISSPESVPTIEKLLSTTLGAEFKIVEDKTLSSFQAFVRIGSKEVEVDFEPVCSAVKRQFNAIQLDVEKDAKIG